MTSVSIAAMKRAGATSDLIVAMIEEQDAIDAAAASEARLAFLARKRKNQRAYRVRQRTGCVRRCGTQAPDMSPVTQKNSPDISMDALPPLPATPSPPIPPPPREDHHKGHNPEKSGVSEVASALAIQVADLAGVGADPTLWPIGWLGSGPFMLAQAWIDNGWKPEEVRLGVEQTMATADRKRHGTPYSPRYFERQIAKVVADRSRVLPDGKPIVAEFWRAKRGSATDHNRAAAERVKAKLRGESGQSVDAGGSDRRRVAHDDGMATLPFVRRDDGSYGVGAV